MFTIFSLFRFTLARPFCCFLRDSFHIPCSSCPLAPDQLSYSEPFAASHHLQNEVQRSFVSCSSVTRLSHELHGLHSLEQNVLVAET